MAIYHCCAELNSQYDLREHSLFMSKVRTKMKYELAESASGVSTEKRSCSFVLPWWADACRKAQLIKPETLS